ncbi:Tn3 family transposase [Mesorhizobium sp. f-mel]
MRRNATGGLNKSESQNALVRALFFNRLGELRDRTFESPSYRPSGLKLLINAIAYWNTLYLEPAFAELNREGIATPPDVIKPITPLGCQPISLTGDYIWTPTDRRPQVKAARNIHSRSVITVCSRKSDRFTTFVS